VNAVETRTSTGDAPFPDRRGNKDVDLGINKIAATPVGPRDGSCPILYSWREDAQAWIYHGKVLHNADGPEQAMTDRLSFPSLRTRFRIAEEEPEASFIDHVHLNLTLRDGRTVRLEPRQPVSHVIRANTAADVDFELPADISPNEVLKSEIEIGGYYRRYSEVLSAETDATSAAGQAQTPARLPQQ
jgi:hypothetical protein